jgi:hypothetical protein
LGAGKNADDDWILKWTRRTRYPTGWVDDVDVPLGEATEAYEIDILDDSDEVIRTLEASEETVTYTADQQIEDFGVVRESVSFVVYQMSAVVGRGYPAAGSLGSMAPSQWAAAYYWRIKRFVPSTGPLGLGLQFAEFQFWTGSPSAMLVPEVVSWHTVALGGVDSSICDSDLNTEVFWNQNNSITLVATQKFSTKVRPSRMRFGFRISEGYQPNIFDLESSNDGSNWTLVKVMNTGNEYPGNNTYGTFMDIS